jgi:hypothetical protein
MLHIVWLSISTVPAFATIKGSDIETASMTSMSVPHCHEADAKGETLTTAPAPTNTSDHSHMPCCATQCHCLSGFCAVILPTAAATMVEMGFMLAPAFKSPAPRQALFELELRPPIFG